MNSETFSIQVQSSLKEETLSSLILLYGPLMGNDAVFLYQSLYLLRNRMQEGQLNGLLSSCRLSKTRFQAARKKLEQYSLLHSYCDKETHHWLFLLSSPKEPEEFLKHDVYSRLFLEKEGSGQLDRMKVLFSFTSKITSSMVDVSEPLDLSLLDAWTLEKEQALDSVPLSSFASSYPFDFGLMFQGMDRIIPQRLRTKENLQRIHELARIFGIDEKTMRRYLSLSIDPSKTRIDFEQLRERVLQARKTKTSKQDPYALSPVAFLQWKQNGMPVSVPDKLLLEKIMVDYKLPNEVINVLIDYALQATDQKFNRSFVEKVASSWARLHIDTKEKAQEQTQARQQTKEELPSWYQDTKQQENDPNLEEEIESMLQALKEESSDGNL